MFLVATRDISAVFWQHGRHPVHGIGNGGPGVAPGWKHRGAGSIATRTQAGVAMLLAGADGGPCVPGARHLRKVNRTPAPEILANFIIFSIGINRRTAGPSYFSSAEIRTSGPADCALGREARLFWWRWSIASVRMRPSSAIMLISKQIGERSQLPELSFLRGLYLLGRARRRKICSRKKYDGPPGGQYFSENKLRRARPFRRGAPDFGFSQN